MHIFFSFINTAFLFFLHNVMFHYSAEKLKIFFWSMYVKIGSVVRFFILQIFCSG